MIDFAPPPSPQTKDIAINIIRNTEIRNQDSKSALQIAAYTFKYISWTLRESDIRTDWLKLLLLEIYIQVV